jgi:endonuclease/exonuclease/phosphatase family metal-dependent hydrolase
VRGADEDLRRRIDDILESKLRSSRTARGTLSIASINTHRGRGPKVEYLLRGAEGPEAERIALLHDHRAYSYYIADWLNRNRGFFDVVGLQEVFNGILGLGQRLFGRFPQHAYYRVFSGFRSAEAHGVGFAGFRYENLLLSHLDPAPADRIRRLLPGRVFGLAACGFILAPFRFADRTVWIGNTHLHAYNPRARMLQADALVRTIRSLGDAPVVLMGDLNSVPPGCRDGDFPAGDRDVRSYTGDRTLGVLEGAGLRTVRHRDEEPFWTYPTGAPNRTLDYVLFSRHWEVESYRVERGFLLSDHYPVVAELRLRG